MTTEIEILGHKGKIGNIWGKLSTDPLRYADHLVVYVEFDQAVESTLGITIALPATYYSRDDFLAAVKENGEIRLTQVLEDVRQQQAALKAKDDRRQKVDGVVQWLKDRHFPEV